MGSRLLINMAEIYIAKDGVAWRIQSRLALILLKTSSSVGLIDLASLITMVLMPTAKVDLELFLDVPLALSHGKKSENILPRRWIQLDPERRI